MNLATNLFIAYIIYFVSTYVKLLFNKDKRKSHQDKRVRLDELRNISCKTEEQQREFLDLKYPKTPPFRWGFKPIVIVIIRIAVFVFIYYFIRKLWENYVPFYFALWQVILIIAIVPIIINKILSRFNLQHDDLTVFFRREKK